MVKIMFKILCVLLSFCVSAFSIDTQTLTYEWLFMSNGADFIPHFQRLFNKMKVKTFIQTGSSYETQFFLDNCENVLTLQLMHPGVNNNYYNECFDLFKQSPKWTAITFNSDFNNASFNNACDYQCSQHKDYALIDSKYLEDLNEFLKSSVNLIKRKKSNVSVAFVKTYGIYIRGDLVNLFLKNKIPVVVATETNSDVGTDVAEGLYGWFKVHTPEDYEKIYIPFSSGTTFWINKEYPELIDHMKRYCDNLLKMKEAGILYYDAAFLKAVANLP